MKNKIIIAAFGAIGFLLAMLLSSNSGYRAAGIIAGVAIGFGVTSGIDLVAGKYDRPQTPRPANWGIDTQPWDKRIEIK